MNNAISPTLGTNPVILAFIAFLVGGVTDFRGTIVATLMVVIIPELLTSLTLGPVSIGSSWKMVIVFIIAITILMIRPNGLFAKNIRKS